ncbi:hypothetical protein E2C01_037807 [Portunus trituberculatus]|uniref:Uncharacterized protein n=1 Tax=Portunus trituberculatus TaxID=210409 RepID=A0A5B7FGA5_PORTR|nr:hypothetical protein [Portunus trituberculatus]
MSGGLTVGSAENVVLGQTAGAAMSSCGLPDSWMVMLARRSASWLPRASEIQGFSGNGAYEALRSPDPSATKPRNDSEASETARTNPDETIKVILHARESLSVTRKGEKYRWRA